MPSPAQQIIHSSCRPALSWVGRRCTRSLRSRWLSLYVAAGGCRSILGRASQRNIGRRRSVHRSICRRRGPTTADHRSRRRPSPARAAATPIVQRVSMGAACCRTSARAAASMTRVTQTRTVRRGRPAPAIRCCLATRVCLLAAASTPTAAWPDSVGPSLLRAQMRSTNTAAIRPPINVWPTRIVPRASRASPFLEGRGCANRPRSVANVRARGAFFLHEGVERGRRLERLPRAAAIAGLREELVRQIGDDGRPQLVRVVERLRGAACGVDALVCRRWNREAL